MKRKFRCPRRRVFLCGWAFKVLSSVSSPSRTWDSDGPLHTDSQRPTAATKCGASRPGSSGTSQGQSAGDLNRPDRFGAGPVPQVAWLPPAVRRQDGSSPIVPCRRASVPPPFTRRAVFVVILLVVGLFLFLSFI